MCYLTDNVFSIEIALDLNELESLDAARKDIRNKLEKATAKYNATRQRPTGRYSALMTHC